MYQKLTFGELKKLIASIKISSVLIQLTYLAFPLSMYIIYNKIVASHNLDAILIVVIFLAFIVIVQLAVKTIEAIQKNIFKTDYLIKQEEKHLYNYLVNSTQQPPYNFATLQKIAVKSGEIVEQQISNAYFWFLIGYFIVIFMIGKIIVLIPMILYGINYIIARELMHKYYKADNKYHLAYNDKVEFTKKILQKVYISKNIWINEKIDKEIFKKSYLVNKYKSEVLYLKNLILKISMAINMLTTIAILIIGRYLYNFDMVQLSQAITCSIITACAARTLGQIFINIKIKNNNKIAFAGDVKPKKDDSAVLKSEQENNYNIIKNKLSANDVVVCNHSVGSYFDEIYNKLLSEYYSVAYINKNINLFYASVLDNISLFDKDKYTLAQEILKYFNVDNLIHMLPFQMNYVITDGNDEIIPYDLKLAIAITRELIAKPEILIFDYDIEELGYKIKTGLLTYMKDNNIKLIFKKYDFNLNIMSKDSGANLNVNTA